MKKFKKQFTAWLLMFSLVFCMMPVNVWAAVAENIAAQGYVHEHNFACYSEYWLNCGQEEGEGHLHTSACYSHTDELVCGMEDGQTYYEGEYTRSENYVARFLVCGQQEHEHSDECIAAEKPVVQPIEELKPQPEGTVKPDTAVLPEVINPEEEVKPEEDLTTAQPATPVEGEDPEEQSQGPQPAADETPAEGEEPGADENLDENDQPAADETPAEGDEPGVDETPNLGDEPGAGEGPDEDQEPGADETPAEGDEPGAGEDSDEDQPAADETPTEGDEQNQETGAEESDGQENGAEDQGSADENNEENDNSGDDQAEDQSDSDNESGDQSAGDDQDSSDDSNADDQSGDNSGDDDDTDEVGSEVEIDGGEYDPVSSLGGDLTYYARALTFLSNVKLPEVLVPKADSPYTCGLEEHSHDDSCYEYVYEYRIVENDMAAELAAAVEAFMQAVNELPDLEAISLEDEAALQEISDQVMAIGELFMLIGEAYDADLLNMADFPGLDVALEKYSVLLSVVGYGINLLETDLDTIVDNFIAKVNALPDAEALSSDDYDQVMDPEIAELYNEFLGSEIDPRIYDDQGKPLSDTIAKYNALVTIVAGEFMDKVGELPGLDVLGSATGEETLKNYFDQVMSSEISGLYNLILNSGYSVDSIAGLRVAMDRYSESKQTVAEYDIRVDCDLKEYLAGITGSNFNVTLNNSDNKPVTPDENGIYNVTIGIPYKLNFEIAAPAFQNGTYSYQLPECINASESIGSGELYMENGNTKTVFGTWEIQADGKLVLNMTDVKKLNNVHFNVTMDIKFENAEDIEKLFGDIKIVVNQPEIKTPGLTKNGNQVLSDTSGDYPIYWNIEFTGGTDNPVVGKILTDTTNETHELMYGVLTFQVKIGTVTHKWIVTDKDVIEDRPLTEADLGKAGVTKTADGRVIGWQYVIPEEIQCVDCGQTIKLEDNYTYAVYYHSKPINPLAKGESVTCYNHVEISGLEADKNVVVVNGEYGGTIYKNQADIPNASFGKRWTISLTLPEVSQGTLNYPSYILSDYAYIIDSNKNIVCNAEQLWTRMEELFAKYQSNSYTQEEYDEYFAKRDLLNSLNTVQNLETAKQFSVKIQVWDGTKYGEAEDVPPVETANGAEYAYRVMGTTLALYMKYDSTDTSHKCDFYLDSNGVKQGNLRVTSGDGTVYCPCWQADKKTLITITYDTPDDDMVKLLKAYGMSGLTLANQVDLSVRVNDTNPFYSWITKDIATAPLSAMFDKTQLTAGTVGKGGIVAYSININEEHANLKQDKLVITDKMQGLVYNEETDIHIFKTPKTGEPTELVKGKDYTVAWDNVNTLTITIPGKPETNMYTINYSATVTNENGTFSNSASVQINGVTFEREAKNDNSSSVEFGASQVSIPVLKVDNNDNTVTLPGATIGLYKVVGNSAPLVHSLTTDKDGKGVFQSNSSIGVSILPHTLYYLKEMMPPANYKLDTTKHYFIICGDTDCEICKEWKEDKTKSITIFSEDASAVTVAPIMITNKLKGEDDETGSLTIKKIVAPAAGETLEADDTSRLFKFDIEIDNLGNKNPTNYYGNVKFTNGHATIELTAGQSITVTGLPMGTTYKVTEQTVDGYSVAYEGAVGTISKENVNADAVITNTKAAKRGKLIISKVVSGVDDNDNDKVANKTFTFTVTDQNGASQTATVTGAGSTTIDNLQPGTYTITENSGTANIPGYKLTVPPDATATVIAGNTATAEITNTYTKLGSLEIHKTVNGIDKTAVANKVFTFTVKGPDNYSDTVTIKGAGSKTINDLVPGDYTVTENSEAANIRGYKLTVSPDATATVSAGSTATAEITNTYTELGSLEIHKTVNGIDETAVANKTFKFTVTGPENYSKTVTIKGVDSTTINDLVPGDYIITETDADNVDYYDWSVAANNVTATVKSGETAEAYIINNYTRQTGELIVGKTVAVENGSLAGTDTTLQFTFTVTLNDKSINKKFNGIKVTNGAETSADVTFTNGSATIKLAHNESQKITGLPAGVEYTVTEAVVSGFTPDKNDVTGKITADTSAKVDFVNTRNIPQTGSLKITKAINGGGNEAANKVYSFTIQGLFDAEKGEYGYNETKTITGAQNLIIANLAPGEYTVTETSAEIEGYNWTVEGNGVTVEVKANQSYDQMPEVKITNNYVQIPGSLTITKAIVGGGDEVASKVFSFTVTGPDNYSENVTITGAGSETLTGLTPGEYTVTENSETANIEGYTWTVTGDNGVEAQNGVEVTVEPDKEATTTITNTYTQELGKLTITKAVNGVDNTLVTEKVFNFTVTDQNGVTREVNITGANSVTLEDLPVGTYTVTENSETANIEGYAWTVAGNNVEVTVANDQTATTTITNTYTQEIGSLIINKVVNGVDNTLVAEKVFNFTVTDQNGVTREANITGANSVTLENLPVGSYTVTENSATAGIDGYTLTVSPDVTVTVNANQIAQATITNTYERVIPTQETTTFSVNKAWDDNNNATGVRPDSVTVQLLQNSTAYGETIVLNAGNNWQGEWRDLPKKDANDETYIYTVEEVIVPEGYEVSYNPAATSATIINKLITETPEGSLTVTKQTSGNAPADTVYIISVNLTYPDGGTDTRNLELRAGEHEIITGLPVGTTYTVTEGSFGQSRTDFNYSDNDNKRIDANDADTVIVTNVYPEPQNPPTPATPTTPETPGTPETPSGGESDNPETPIENPETPTSSFELPDPNEPFAPDEVTIFEDDVPLTYVKTYDPDTEEYVYIEDDDVPLAYFEDDIPKTGDAGYVTLLAAVWLISLSGMGALVYDGRRRKNN